MPDLAVVKASAVAALRSALTSGNRVEDALRWCWYRNPMFSSTLFTEGMRRWFGEGCDIRNITRFIVQIHDERMAHPAAFPAREAEALIRAALGEAAFLDEVHPSRFNYPEIGIAVLDRLFREWRPDANEVGALLDRVEEVLNAAYDGSQELTALESDWYAAGMHESPFAVWQSERPGHPFMTEGRSR